MSSRVSIVRGQRQATALRRIGWIAGMTMGSTLFLGDKTDFVGVVGLALLIATPPLRVVWLVFRWSQERDWRFVGVGICLLALIGLTALWKLG